MNGTTGVTLNADHFRLQGILALTVGSSGMNLGAITVQVSGGGNVRGEIPFTDIGFGVSQDGRFTIPAGKTGYGLQFVPFFPKGKDGAVRATLRTNGGPILVGAEFPFYQSAIVIPIKVPIAAPEKTDITFQAKATGGGVSLVSIVDFLIIDN